MTTDDMRAAAVANFDRAAADLRAVVNDPTLTNPEYRELKDALASVQYEINRINRIIRVNWAIMENER